MIEQGSPGWHAQRCGKVTASRIADLMAKTKSGWAASRANYRAQLVAERLTGTVAESYSNAAMEWGTATEAEARQAYEFYRGVEVQQVGFIPHQIITMSGASPDGLVPSYGLVELKCPNTATHIDTLLGQSIAGKYLLQMQWQMACTGRQWCDFVSYDPRLPEEMRLFIQRVERDEQKITEISNAVTDFLVEVSENVSELERRYRAPLAAE